jgi:NADH:ubiquinone reductase (H+-translocating)
VWAGGVKPNPVIDSAGLKLGHHHAIAVDECCRVEGHPDVWALGDCAEVPKPGHQGSYAPTAQNAIREGALVARNIVARLQGGSPEPFAYHPIGELAIVGRRSGVASVYGLHFSGIVAWAMWRAIYLAKLPTLPQRVRIASHWLMDLALGRTTGVAVGGIGTADEKGRKVA